MKPLIEWDDGQGEFIIIIIRQEEYAQAARARWPGDLQATDHSSPCAVAPVVGAARQLGYVIGTTWKRCVTVELTNIGNRKQPWLGGKAEFEAGRFRLEDADHQSVLAELETRNRTANRNGLGCGMH